MLVKPQISGSKLLLTAPKMNNFSLDISEVVERSVKRKTQVWEATIDVVDCGDEAAQWFSKYCLQQDEGLRLFYYPLNKPTKPVRPNDKKRWPKTTSNKHTGSTHDATSYMIMNSESVDALNEKLDEPVVPLRFRPNVLFKGMPAFQEDNLKWVRIGEKTVFKYVMPCTRCTFTTINPITAERHPNNEPLKTLKR